MALNRRGRVAVIAILPAIVILLALFLPRIPQDQAYHNFADQRSLLGIPNFMDVATNLPMLLAGLAGLIFMLGERRFIPGPHFSHVGETIPYGLFFLAVALTSLGSTYYHWQPANGSLSWDRLPLSLVFVSMLAAALAERVNRNVALVLLLPLAILAVSSVIYWNLTEARGLGDLRPYLVVQLVPILVIPLTISLFPPSYDRTGDLAIAVGIYVVAKLCEYLDAEIYGMGQMVSGHSLKHCFAALAIFWIYRMLRLRQTCRES